MHSSRMRTVRLLTVSCSALVGDVDPPSLDSDPPMQTFPPDADPPGYKSLLDSDPLPLDADPLSLDAAS